MSCSTVASTPGPHPWPGVVDLLHQLTDVLGIAVGGIEGNRFMGFGFPDQTLIWDGSALQNTRGALLEEQSPPLPMRTMDISSGFNGSLAATETIEAVPDAPSDDHLSLIHI